MTDFKTNHQGKKDIEKLNWDFEFSRDKFFFHTKGDFWEKIYSLFGKGRFWKKILLSLRRREIFKGENVFSLPKGDFEGRISLRILPFTEGRKELPKGENIGHPWSACKTISFIFLAISAFSLWFSSLRRWLATCLIFISKWTLVIRGHMRS